MIRRRSAMAAAGAIGLTLTAAVGAIAANTGLLGTASSAGRVGQLSPVSIPATSARAAPSSTAITVNVEPLAGLAVQLRTLGADVRVCALPDCAELLARVDVPLVPIGVWR